VTRNLTKAVTEEELLKIIDELNKDDSVDGILVQLPLPDHINERKVRELGQSFVHKLLFSFL
jgi:5,10-methylene-tetrahydrofolate dehydrogenase/methenyl tetrahydrofolate cyclohydrolase